MYKLTYFLIVLSLQSSFSQTHFEDTTSVNLYFSYLKNLEFNKAINIAPDKDFKILAKIISDKGETPLENFDIEIKNFEYVESASMPYNSIRNLIRAYILLWYKNDRISSYPFFRESYSQASKTTNSSLKKYSLLSMLSFFRKGSLQNDNGYMYYLDEYKNLCVDEVDWLYYYSNKKGLLSQTETYNEKKTKLTEVYKSIFKSYDSLIEVANTIKKVKIFYYKDKGNHIIRDNPNEARNYFQNALDLMGNENYFRSYKQILLQNLSRVCSLTNEHLKGLSYLNEAQMFININDSITDFYYINAYKANHFYNLKQFDSAFYYEREVRFLGYKLNFQKHNTEISKIEKKLGVKEKEIENLQLKEKNIVSETKRKQNRNLLITALGLLIFIGITFYLIQKNTKRKQLLAEKDKFLETQKVTTLLKEQELMAIDAMIEGQEKERQRMANDLHDDLGGLMATVKLHFNMLKEKHSPKLYEKTDNLLEEAYQKIRRIAHAKNSGVFAKQGLLKAVKEMARTVSASNKINVELIDYGLDERLENSLELTIFRVIQELITNVIKHAFATEVTIHITNHEDSLNIMIEDNGKGFNPEKIAKTSGMGIHSIDKRIENLGGTVTIESEINKGTTVIIEIPS